MKTIIKVFAMLFGILIILSVSSCKKDKDTSGDNNINYGDGVRLKEWKYYEEGVFQTRVNLTYVNQKLTEVNYYDTQKSPESLTRQTVVEYTENTAVIIDYWPDQNGNLLIWDITEVIFEGSNVIEINVYDYISGGGSLSERDIYIYDNNLLVESYSFYENNQDPSSKYVYSYNDGKILKIEHYTFNYNVFDLHSKTVWTYTDSRISEIITSELHDDWQEYLRSEFTYQGKLVFLKDYEYYNGSWVLEEEMEITLDDNGNTIKLVYTDSWFGQMTAQFYYEAGSGNFDVLMFGPGANFIPYRLPF